MAAIVSGLVPLLSAAVETSTTYKGRTVWFGLLCVRLVTLFVAEMPWFSLERDFSCNDTGICTKACFNQHFDKPVLMAWNFLFILLLLSVFLMELFTAHVRTVLMKQILRKQKAMEVDSLGELKSTPSVPTKEVMFLDMHGSMYAVLSYLFSMILRIVVEVWFVYILLFWNLPTVRQKSFLCNARNHGCPVLQCLVSATAEKSMSIYAMLSISFLVIVTSCMFCFYFIGHYVCKCCTQR
ncbi:uncharacterized protein gjz1 [Astyanax mexicanus]|uniref:Uncharacterized LOC103039243 n=2 Tax=Astyanax mexicanus TaxID=7994 RepID=A0A8B9L9L3_ASTMX|nr:uncharacterized protein gjz1 [Astyanax mexicanus]KAG9267850.1 hypothetical protein AMEX_G18722 [Astyanax mexicanus]